MENMSFRKLKAFEIAFEQAMEIFEITKTFPKEETYSLTDQIRRSSRSVCANMAEAYRKRIYPKSYVSKLSDSDAENAETLTWLEFALACKYITHETKSRLEERNITVGKLINYMINNHEKFA